uniref:YqgE/AlgH family protein n=1 Tax=Oryza punctata TaxID=4537 RepID=A0A0E0JRY2_ORYPU
MWALTPNSGGSSCLPARHTPPPPPTWAPLPAGEAGSLAAGPGRWWRRRQPVARWPKLAVNASGRKSKSNRDDGDGDEAKNKAASSSSSSSGRFSRSIETDDMLPVCAYWRDWNGKGKGDASAPSGDVSKNELQSNDTMYVPGNLSYWRDVRASFVVPKVQTVDAYTLPQAATDGPVHCLPRKWAHSIPMPESGCVLVAAEELDGNGTFERTVILLLRLGSRDAYDGPFGVILNRPLYTKMKHVNPSFRKQATPFSDCSLFFGGPVDMSIFLMRTTDGTPIKGFEEVSPGVCFGFRTDLEKASALLKSSAVKPEDLNFYVGYSAWDYDQLLSEIDQGYWHVTSCSSGLISDALATDPSCLWTEILKLMGGQYAELSQKPKEDGS